MKISLMSHLIAGFPTNEVAFLCAKSLVKGGAKSIEIQLPFSEPSADGEAISSACAEVLKGGFSVSEAFDLAEKIRGELGVEVVMMSYASLVFTPGVERFAKHAAARGVSGLIVPDLPFDLDEGLRAACEENGMEMIPVAAPSMSDERLGRLKEARFGRIYAALRTGITGLQTQVTEQTRVFLNSLREENLQKLNLSSQTASQPRILGGFGITDRLSAAAAAPFVDQVVAGSVFVRLITANRENLGVMQEALEAKAREICGE